mgnify:CR=1 FL=1
MSYATLHVVGSDNNRSGDVAPDPAESHAWVAAALASSVTSNRLAPCRRMALSSLVMCFIWLSIVVKYERPEYEYGLLSDRKFGNRGTLMPS